MLYFFSLIINIRTEGKFILAEFAEICLKRKILKPEKIRPEKSRDLSKVTQWGRIQIELRIQVPQSMPYHPDPL